MSARLPSIPLAVFANIVERGCWPLEIGKSKQDRLGYSDATGASELLGDLLSGLEFRQFQSVQYLSIHK